MFDKDNITPEWVTSVLRNNGFLEKGTIKKVHITRILNGVSSLFFFEITPSNSRVLDKISRNMVLKCNEFSNEGRFYCLMRDRSFDLPIPNCYNLNELKQNENRCLLLNDLSETYESMGNINPPSKSRCEMAINSLAKIHTSFWDHSDLEKVIPHENTIAYMLIKSKNEFPRIIKHVFEFLDDKVSEDRKRIYNIVSSQFPGIKLNRLNLGKHLTLTHGDAWLGNFLFPKQNNNYQDNSNYQVNIIDWESSSVGFGPNDLAHMIGLNWNPERRKSLEQDLVKHYHEELKNNGIQDYSWENCWQDYRLGIIGELLTPILFCYWKLPPRMWLHTLEYSYQSFIDLKCLELIREGDLK